MKRAVLLLTLLIVSLQALSQSATTGAKTKVANIEGQLVDGKWKFPVIALSQLLATPHITTDAVGVKVISYSFSLEPSRGNNVGPFHIKGAKLTSDITDVLIDSLGTSGRAVFENIIGMEEDGSVRTMHPVVLQYTN